MLRRLILPALAIASLSTLVSRAADANIIQDTDARGGAAFFLFARDFGQSFTADSSVINLSSVGFYFVDENRTLPNPTLTASLYTGFGYSGPLLGTQTLTIDSTLGSRYLDFSFAGTVLEPTAIYTMRFTANAGTRGGYSYSGNNPYAGGQAIGAALIGPQTDLRFRVLGTVPVPVPEPGTLAGAGLGIALAVGSALNHLRKAA